MPRLSRFWRGHGLQLLLPLALVACAGGGANYGDGFGADAGAGGVPECFSSNECPVGFTCNEFGSCVAPPNMDTDGGVPDPAEVEVELSPPTHSDRFVYVAMSELDSLAKIDGMTLEVASIAVGDQPEELAAIPHADGVVVLDRNNGTVSVVRADGLGEDMRVLPTLPNMNRLSVDPTGHYAVAWFDLRKEAIDNGGLGGVGSIGSFQDVTIVRLDQGMERAVDLTVGFRPRSVQFDAAGQHAFVVSDDGVSVIDLAAMVEVGPSIVAPIPIDVPSDIDPLTVEVNVTASGQLAVVRRAGALGLSVLQLAGDDAGTMVDIDLGETPSDVDLASDSSTAFAVLRDSAMLATVDLRAGLPSASDVVLHALPGPTVGSLQLRSDGREAVLYTNAEAIESLTIVSFEGVFSARTIELEKSVRSIGYDPTGTRLIVTHAKAFGNPFESGISFEEFINRSRGYSVVDVATGFDKLQITAAQPGAFEFSTTSDRAYVLIDGGDEDGAPAETHIIELDTGVVRVQNMSSPPETVGILPNAGMAFVNQRHRLGRVSFLNLTTDAMRTVTGFDLNSRIVD